MSQCCDIELREEVVIITKCGKKTGVRVPVGKNEVIEFGFQKYDFNKPQYIDACGVKLFIWYFQRCFAVKC